MGGAAPPVTQDKNGWGRELGRGDVCTIQSLFKQAHIRVVGGQHSEKGQPGKVAPVQPPPIALERSAQGPERHSEDGFLEQSSHNSLQLKNRGQEIYHGNYKISMLAMLR